MKSIVVVNNHWSNIGNAFFANSIASDLQKIHGDRARIQWGEGPSFYTITPWSGRNTRLLDYGLYTTGDWYVVSGPVFHKEMPDVYGPTFRALKARGTKILIVSAGSNAYDEEEISTCRRFLEEIGPFALSTRDSETYHAYKDCFEHAYDGLCSAFYVPFHYEGYDTPDLDPYVVWGFEHSTEPNVAIRSGASGDSYLDLEISGADGLKTLSTAALVVDNLRTYPETAGRYRLVRPWHHPFSKAALMAYNRPNTFVSSNPYAYLNLFRNAEVTISQRVHGCVPALAYGKPARLYLDTKRSALFRRAGLDDITERYVTLPREKLEAEHNSFQDFLRSLPL